LLRAAGLFIDSQSLVGNGAFSDLAGGSTSLSAFVSAALELGGGRSLRWLQKTIVFLDLLGFYI
jgi:hypothetical protein